jgi:preprotein translocase subunit SecG
MITRDFIPGGCFEVLRQIVQDGEIMHAVTIVNAQGACLGLTGIFARWIVISAPFYGQVISECELTGPSNATSSCQSVFRAGNYEAVVIKLYVNGTQVQVTPVFSVTMDDVCSTVRLCWFSWQKGMSLAARKAFDYSMLVLGGLIILGFLIVFYIYILPKLITSCSGCTRKFRKKSKTDEESGMKEFVPKKSVLTGTTLTSILASSFYFSITYGIAIALLIGHASACADVSGGSIQITQCDGSNCIASYDTSLRVHIHEDTDVCFSLKHGSKVVNFKAKVSQAFWRLELEKIYETGEVGLRNFSWGGFPVYCRCPSPGSGMNCPPDVIKLTEDFGVPTTGLNISWHRVDGTSAGCKAAWKQSGHYCFIVYPMIRHPITVFQAGAPKFVYNMTITSSRTNGFNSPEQTFSSNNDTTFQPFNFSSSTGEKIFVSSELLNTIGHPPAMRLGLGPGVSYYSDLINDRGEFAMNKPGWMQDGQFPRAPLENSITYLDGKCNPAYGEMIERYGSFAKDLPHSSVEESLGAYGSVSFGKGLEISPHEGPLVLVRVRGEGPAHAFFNDFACPKIIDVEGVRSGTLKQVKISIQSTCGPGTVAIVANDGFSCSVALSASVSSCISDVSVSGQGPVFLTFSMANAYKNFGTFSRNVSFPMLGMLPGETVHGGVGLSSTGKARDLFSSIEDDLSSFFSKLWKTPLERALVIIVSLFVVMFVVLCLVRCARSKKSKTL